MKSFFTLLKEMPYMRWSISEKDIANFSDIPLDLIQAVQQAHAAIWGAYDFDFKKRQTSLIFQPGQGSVLCPSGTILKVMTKEGKEVERVEAPLLPVTSKGTPTGYWVSSGGELSFNISPLPEKSEELFILYDTWNKAVSADGTEKANFEFEDDILNVPASLEEAYLNALKNKAMCYMIADNQDENYAPYIAQYEEQFQNALLSLRTGGAESFLRIYDDDRYFY